MEKDKQQINLNIVEGDPFFAHEVSMNFTPTQITLDFKCITPRTDPRGQAPSFLLKHNVVMLEPWHARMMLDVLSNVLKKYEDDFSKISQQKSIQKVAKKQKKASKKKKSSTKTTGAPSYLG